MAIQRFDSNRFFAVARELAKAPYDEGRLRTAVGRAYYAAFLATRAHLGVSNTELPHGATIREAKARDLPFGNQLDAFRRLRIEADYEMVPVSAASADWNRNWGRALLLATRLLGQVASLPKQMPPKPS
jgi:hypothetical protein